MSSVTRKRVLVVEENRDGRQLLRIQLQQLGVDIWETKSGKEARALLNAQRPDMLITEIVLPEGFREGLRIVARARELYPDLPIVVYTTQTMCAMRDAALKVGANEFITKPSKDFAEFRKTIASHIAVA